MKNILMALVVALLPLSLSAAAAEKKIILLAGRPSHGAGEHEHRAGMMLLQQGLAGVPGIKAEVYSINMAGWVDDVSIFNDAAAVIIYADGAGGHPYLKDDHLQQIGALAAKGVGIGMIHYAVEPTIEKGEKEFMAWTGGAFEVNYSVNPIYLGDFKQLPQHPVTRGVKPFATTDEWYFHIRFPEGMKGVTPILVTTPPQSSMNRPYAPTLGAREGNESVWAAVRNKEPQTVMWVTERADGGRGFGFSGGHYLTNWGIDDQRKLVLNAILWSAKVEVPANGVVSTVTPAMLRSNLDPKAGGRGGVAATPEAVTLSSFTAMTSLENANNTDSRRELLIASLTDRAAIPAKLKDVTDAALNLALARAKYIALIQASPEKLPKEQIDTLIQNASR